MFNFFADELRQAKLLEFHEDVIARNDLSQAEKNFWMCLCNDFEDWKFNFIKLVAEFLSWQKDRNKPIDRVEWLKFVGDQTLRQQRKL